MNDYDEKWEAQINALLDGELDQADAEQLKLAAGDDRKRARAIVEAYQLQQALDAVSFEKAPASLRKRLRAIPREQRSKAGWGVFGSGFHPQWVLGFASLPLVIIIATLMQPQAPSAAEVAKARHDLAIAFSYLDKAGNFTGREIESKVGKTMADAVTGSVIRSIKLQYQSPKENKT